MTRLPTYYRGPNAQETLAAGRVAADLAVVVAVIAAVIAVSATAPPNTYYDAQWNNVGTAIAMVQTGDWLLPRNQMDHLPRKPQLFYWALAGLLKLTGAHNDWVFRIPTMASALAMGVLIYALGRRWYGRRAGLLAACLWATLFHMSRLMYLAVSDMLFAALFLGAVFCADRILFHPAAPPRRGRWAIGLWACIILGAATKGWGLVNLPLVALIAALATAVGPGFGALRRVRGRGSKLLLACRLIGRRWRAAMKAVRLGWGLLATAAILAPMLVPMFLNKEWREEIFYYEFVQRLTGLGPAPPGKGAAPPVLWLLYYALPASIFALCAMLLVRPRRWLARKGPLCLPLCWIVGVTVPFSLTHGFRPRYLAPCYPAVVLMAAWAVGEVNRRLRRPDRFALRLRHVFAALPVVAGCTLMLLPWAYFLHGHLPAAVQKLARLPRYPSAGAWIGLGAACGVGFVVAALATRWSLRRQLWRVAAVTVPAGLGLLFLDAHFNSRHARTGDGQKMLTFARQVEGRIGRETFAIFRARKFGTEVYLGRLGEHYVSKAAAWDEAAGPVLAGLRRSKTRWLITCDRGLAELGAAEQTPDGPWRYHVRGRVRAFRTRPELLGNVEVIGEAAESNNYGRTYLIRLRRPIAPVLHP